MVMLLALPSLLLLRPPSLLLLLLLTMPVFRTNILHATHAYGFDSIRILFSRGEVLKMQATPQEFGPQGSSHEGCQSRSWPYRRQRRRRPDGPRD